MNAITTVNPDAERALVDVMRASLYPGAKPESVGMVLAYCRARNLDPLRKPVHIVPMWVTPAGTKQGGMQDVVMPGIALYRIEAARTGEYAGKSEPEFGPERVEEFEGGRVRFPEWCRVTVYRMVAGQRCEFTAKEFWLENYATQKRDTDMPNAMWKKRAWGQLAKCAEAQALRMAFPEATGGEPTAEEMEGKVLAPRDVPNAAHAETARPAPPAEDMLPVLAPDGSPKHVPAGKWLAAVGRALALLEDAAAVRSWRAEMEPHIATVAKADNIKAGEADRLIAGRLAEFDAREPGEEG